MNAIQNGFQAVGIMHGFKSEPWINVPTNFNHRILLANPFLDGNGFQQTEVMSIDVQRVPQLANEFKENKWFYLVVVVLQNVELGCLGFDLKDP